MKDAAKSPWLALHTHTQEEDDSVLTHEEERQVATELKEVMGIKSDTEKILTYVKKKHRYGTTAGCFNILAMEQENRGLIQ